MLVWQDKQGWTPLRGLYWANRRDFVKPGLVLWTGTRHIRILPVPRKAWR